MKRTKINSTKFIAIKNKIVIDGQVLSLDSDDIRDILMNKSGIMYQATRKKDESILDFTTAFFDKLKSFRQVNESTHYLVHIMLGPKDELTMDELTPLHEFVDALGDGKQVTWGMGRCKGVSKMTITVLCTKEDSSRANKQLLVCAPSGTGKTTLVKHLLSVLGDELGFCVSVTTRKPRSGEVNGESYEFVSQELFEEYIRKEALLEYEQVYKGTYYGTLAKNVENIEKQSKMPLFDVDVMGALKLKEIYGTSMQTIFIMPPSLDELRKRLELRGTESAEKIRERVARAEWEMAYKDKFDHVVVNDDQETAKEEILQIAKGHLYGYAEYRKNNKCRMTPEEILSIPFHPWNEPEPEDDEDEDVDRFAVFRITDENI